MKVWNPMLKGQESHREDTWGSDENLSFSKYEDYMRNKLFLLKFLFLCALTPLFFFTSSTLMGHLLDIRCSIGVRAVP